jgi:hypothetical protein
VSRRIRIEKTAVQALQTQMVQPAERVIREQLLHEQVASHSIRRRTKHCDQLRKTARDTDHFLRFRQIHCHSRLTEYVFARFECGERHSRMDVRRAADPNDIDLRNGE